MALPVPSPSPRDRHGLISRYLAQRQTAPHPIVSPPLPPLGPPVSPDTPTVVDSLVKPAPTTPPPKKQPHTLYFVLALMLILTIGLYFLWRPSSTATTTPPITQQNFGSSTGTTSTDTTNHNIVASGGIQAYIVGAVKHPGVYILAANARVYQLLQAAGGPLPDANLVNLNLAAKLTDGQEVYVTRQGERPPSYVGGVPAPGPTSDTTTGSLVNINTASATELQQQLHISSTTAAEIINYRTQHGNFTSVDQLSAAVSKTTYDKIKGLVTV
jgi:competence protein ComEA